MTTSPAERFRALYDTQVIALLGYAARRVARAEDAADIVADVFTTAWRRIEDVPIGAEARPWLFGVARNVIGNHRRGAWRRDRLTDRLRGELRLISSANAANTSNDISVDDVVDVRRALARLSADDREMLLLTNWEGLAPTEIATAMGIPPGTVRSRLHRARQQLRGELERNSERFVTSGHVHAGGHPLATELEEPR